MIWISVVLALFVAWIWVDYYRLIDIYQENSLVYFVIIFGLGFVSPSLVFLAHDYFLDSLNFYMNGNFVNDFVYNVVMIGALEELTKLVPFLMFYALFRKQFKEPIDYLAYISTAALGFAAAENIMYMETHGISVISLRSILSTVGHMFFTSLIAYGIILYKYQRAKYGTWIMLAFIGLSSLSHGFYDFWLLHEPVSSWGWIVTIAFFFLSISWFATIINNAINNSSFFTYKKIIDARKVSQRLLLYYACIFMALLLINTYHFGFQQAFWAVPYWIFTSISIIVVSVIRLSRFHPVRGEWQKIGFEFPFSIVKKDPYGIAERRFHFHIKGDKHNASKINYFMQDFFQLAPVRSKQKNNNFFHAPQFAFLEDFVNLDNGQIGYWVKVYSDQSKSSYINYVIAPKEDNITNLESGEPIVAVLRVGNEITKNTKTIPIARTQFVDWCAVLKSV